MGYGETRDKSETLVSVDRDTQLDAGAGLGWLPTTTQGRSFARDRGWGLLRSTNASTYDMAAVAKNSAKKSKVAKKPKVPKAKKTTKVSEVV